MDIGENYLLNGLKEVYEKLTSFLKDKIDNIKYEDAISIKKKAKEFAEKLIINFKEVISKNDYKKDEIYINFKKNEVKSMINEIFKEEKIDENIKNQIKRDLEDFSIKNNSNMINILLMGKESKEKNKFIEIITKVFHNEKNKENENIINVELKELKKIKKINLLEYNNINNLNININCIWYFIEAQIKDIDIKNIKTDNLSNNIPIIYIHFKDKIIKEKIELSSNLNIYDDNIDNNNYIIENHIIDIKEIIEQYKKNNENIKEYFINLIEKSILNILIKDNEFKLEDKSKGILDIILPRINFAFGNTINNLSNLNSQIIYIIFKEFLFEKEIPKSVKKKYIKLLHNYQKYLENRQNIYFSILLLKNNSVLKSLYRNMNNKINYKLINNDFKNKEEEEKGKLIQEINNKTILFINEVKIINDDKKENKTKNITIKYSCGDDINIIMKNIFDDYFLKNSSIFINEIIVNMIKEISIIFLKKEIIKYYINLYKNEYIFVVK